MPESMNPADDTDTSVVHVIQSTYHYRDVDNRPTSDDTILEDEGWFADAASAAARCDQLNAQNRAHYDVAMARARRERDAKILAAETANREAAILREHGMAKKDIPVPKPFEPVPFEQYVPEHGHTTYEVLPITRSEHDGIARAPEMGRAESDTTGGVVPGTA